MKLTHILCPVDLSEASTHAIEQASAIAGWYHAKVTVLHVHVPRPPLTLDPYGVGAPPVSGSAEMALVREAARAAAAPAIDMKLDVEVVVEVGDPTAEILARAGRIGTGMLVMGTHGASGFQHLVLGSVTEKVLRRARCPVLTVPPRMVHAAAALPFQRILCPIDFSDSSLSALEWAWSLAQESGATVTLLHVIEWPWNEPPAPPFERLPQHEARRLVEFRKAAEASSQQQLQSLVPDNLRDRCPSEPLVRHGKAHREVLAAAEGHADLIVMGVHGRNVVDLALFGSTTNQVVRGASCPVLTVRTSR